MKIHLKHRFFNKPQSHITQCMLTSRLGFSFSRFLSLWHLWIMVFTSNITESEDQFDPFSCPRRSFSENLVLRSTELVFCRLYQSSWSPRNGADDPLGLCLKNLNSGEWPLHSKCPWDSAELTLGSSHFVSDHRHKSSLNEGCLHGTWNASGFISIPIAMLAPSIEIS